ncbi:hypothetical protein [Brevundimonas sp. Root1423]|uniref:hypothetical protein n=1 Tax=Brevundimonas sp. Root1423 TaxID=1736462 RepID=UPI0006FB95B0|nr:hypothetical protein [Brevundimonas sp. Root1423]KQY84561.1 hypothetical protein ASD25_05790 [Brevundimonas sp. Root1423]
MEQLSLTPARRQYAHNAYSRTTDAFETVSWRPPVARRIDARPANDGYRSHRAKPTGTEEFAGLPAWVHIVGGGVAAALMGALLGGALHI